MCPYSSSEAAPLFWGVCYCVCHASLPCAVSVMHRKCIQTPLLRSHFPLKDVRRLGMHVGCVVETITCGDELAGVTSDVAGLFAAGSSGQLCPHGTYM